MHCLTLLRCLLEFCHKHHLATIRAMTNFETLLELKHHFSVYKINALFPGVEGQWWGDSAPGN